MFITSKSKSKPLKVSGEHSHAELVNNGVIVLIQILQLMQVHIN